MKKIFLWIALFFVIFINIGYKWYTRNGCDPHHPGPILILRLNSNNFQLGSPVLATLTITNSGETPIALVRGELWTNLIWVGGWYPNITGPGGCYDYTGARGSSELVFVLKPQESYTAEVNLGDAKLYRSFQGTNHIMKIRMTPGKFKVKMRYAIGEDNDICFRPVWYGETESNEIEFEVSNAPNDGELP